MSKSESICTTYDVTLKRGESKRICSDVADHGSFGMPPSDILKFKKSPKAMALMMCLSMDNLQDVLDDALADCEDIGDDFYSLEELSDEALLKIIESADMVSIQEGLEANELDFFKWFVKNVKRVDDIAALRYFDDTACESGDIFTFGEERFETEENGAVKHSVEVDFVAGKLMETITVVSEEAGNERVLRNITREIR